MALIAFAGTDSGHRRRLKDALDTGWHDLLPCPGWESTLRQVTRRPVGLLVVDPYVLPPDAPSAIGGLARELPGLPIVVLVRRGDARLLFELGRARTGLLELIEAEAPRPVWATALQAGLERAAAGRCTRLLTGVLPSPELAVLRGALETSHRCWSAARLARSFGLSRPMLSDRLKAVGMPSVGHLMVWARLIHAGHWLTDPGRTGEGVARQLEYADGSAFRRALRNYVGLTPTALAARGGLPHVVESFVLRHASCRVAPAAHVA